MHILYEKLIWILIDAENQFNTKVMKRIKLITNLTLQISYIEQVDYDQILYIFLYTVYNLSLIFHTATGHYNHFLKLQHWSL